MTKQVTFFNVVLFKKPMLESVLGSRCVERFLPGLWHIALPLM